MRRRITLTMVGVVAGALAVATLVTVLLLRLETREEARRELGRQAERLAADLEDMDDVGALRALRTALRLEGAQVVRLTPDGRVAQPTLPPGLTADDLDSDRIRAGRTVTGVKGSLAYAAAPAQREGPRPGLLAVVLTRQVGAGRLPLGPRWFAAMALILVVAAGVAASLGRRLGRPLQEAQDVTRRVAAGDLAARVEVDAGAGQELASLGRSINAMAAGLERSRGLERQFLLSVSHDLRTPLTSIRGYAEALAEQRAPDPGHAASVILAEARRLERLVGDLLELAKLDARRFTLDLRSTDVGEVVAETAEGFRPAADKAGVALTVEVGRAGDDGGAGGHVGAGAGVGARGAAADPDRLAQVVANLVENALKYARETIVVGSDGHGFWVEDDGSGIDAADLPHVFEPFYRSTRTPSRPVDTGLGLAIVKDLIEAMGGSVRAEAGRAGGTRMVVSLRPWRTGDRDG